MLYFVSNSPDGGPFVIYILLTYVYLFGNKVISWLHDADNKGITI